MPCITRSFLPFLHAWEGSAGTDGVSPRREFIVLQGRYQGFFRTLHTRGVHTCMRGFVGDSSITSLVSPGRKALVKALRTEAFESLRAMHWESLHQLNQFVRCWTSRCLVSTGQQGYGGDEGGKGEACYKDVHNPWRLVSTASRRSKPHVQKITMGGAGVCRIV